MSLDILKFLDKNMVDAIAKIQDMKNPDVKILTPKNYTYKNKVWDIIILIREQDEDAKEEK